MFSMTLSLHQQVPGAIVFPFPQPPVKADGRPSESAHGFFPTGTFSTAVIFYPFDCEKRFATAVNVRLALINVD